MSWFPAIYFVPFSIPARVDESFCSHPFAEDVPIKHLGIMLILGLHVLDILRVHKTCSKSIIGCGMEASIVRQPSRHPMLARQVWKTLEDPVLRRIGVGDSKAIALIDNKVPR
jgi:hypothetical protein